MPIGRHRHATTILAAIALFATAGCAGLNDRLMGWMFPASELSVEADFDAKHPPKIVKVAPDGVAPRLDTEVTAFGNYLKSMQTNDLGAMWLSRSGQQPVPGRIVHQVGNEIRARFDLAGASGTWDLHLRRADGAQTAVSKAVRVVNDRL